MLICIILVEEFSIHCRQVDDRDAYSSVHIDINKHWLIDCLSHCAVCIYKQRSLCYALSGGLGLSIEGPSKAEIQCQDNKDGTATITYIPTLPGEYKITIKYAGQPISDTPYFAKISAPCKYARYNAAIE